MVPESLETPRLRLRQWQAADAEPFAALNADPEVMRYFPALLSRAESDALLERCQQMIQDLGHGLWALERREDQAFLGFVGLKPAPDSLDFAPVLEVGWRLSRHAWGKGYATEAAQAALRFGFETLNQHEVVSFTAVNNQRSWAVMERLGMKRSGTFEHPALPEGHALRTHVLYRMQSRIKC